MNFLQYLRPRSSPWRLLQTEFYCFCERVSRFISWFPVIWKDRDFDWVYVYRILEFKLRRLAQVLDHGHTVGGSKLAHEVDVAAALCSRIRKDGYISTEPSLGPWLSSILATDRRGTAKFYADYMLEQDIDYLHKYLTKHIRCWWD